MNTKSPTTSPRRNSEPGSTYELPLPLREPSIPGEHDEQLRGYSDALPVIGSAGSDSSTAHSSIFSSGQAHALTPSNPSNGTGLTPATSSSPSPPGRHMSPRKRRRLEENATDKAQTMLADQEPVDKPMSESMALSHTTVSMTSKPLRSLSVAAEISILVPLTESGSATKKTRQYAPHHCRFGLLSQSPRPVPSSESLSQLASPRATAGRRFAAGDPRAALSSDARAGGKQQLRQEMYDISREKSGAQTLPPENQICVSGFDPLRLREAQLKVLFSTYGNIESLEVKLDPRSGQLLPVCSIKYKDSVDSRQKSKPIKSAVEGVKQAVAQQNGKRIGGAPDPITVVADAGGKVAKLLAERAITKPALHKQVTEILKPPPPEPNHNNNRQQSLKIPTGPKAMSSVQANGDIKLPKASEQIARANRSQLETFQVEKELVRPTLPVHVPHIFCQVEGKMPDRFQADGLLNMLKHRAKGVRADRTGFFVSFAEDIAGRVNAKDCYREKTENNGVGPDLFGMRMTMELLIEDDLAWEKRIGEASRREKVRARDERSRDRRIKDADLIDIAFAGLSAEMTEGLLQESHSASRRTFDRVYENASRKSVVIRQVSQPVLRQDHTIDAHGTTVSDHLRSDARLTKPQSLPTVSNPDNNLNPYQDERRRNMQDRNTLRRQLKSKPSKATHSRPVVLHAQLNQADEDDEEESDSEQRSRSTSARASEEPRNRPQNRRMEQVSGRKRRSRSNTLVINTAHGPAVDDDEADDHLATPRKKTKLGPSPLSRLREPSPQQDDEEPAVEMIADATSPEKSVVSPSVQSSVLKSLENQSTSPSSEPRILTNLFGSTVADKENERSDELANERTGELSPPQDRLPKKPLPQQAKKKQPKKAKPTKKQLFEARATRRQLDSEEPVQIVVSEADDVLRARSPLAQTTVTGMINAVPDAAAESDHEGSESGAESVAEVIQGEWARPTEGGPRRTIEDDPTICMDIDGWQDCLLDDEDFLLLRQALERYEPPEKPQAAEKDQATEQNQVPEKGKAKGKRKALERRQALEEVQAVAEGQAVQEGHAVPAVQAVEEGQAVEDIPAAEIADIWEWSHAQKELKKLMRDGDRGVSRTELSIPGYYKRTVSGCARTEAYCKPLEAEKSKYLPHRLKVFREREARQNRTKNGDRTPNPLHTVPRTMAPIGMESSRDRRANQRRQAFDMANQQAALSRASGVAAPTDAEAFQFNQLKKRKKALRFDRSPIHNWGLFAMEPIARDEMIIEYVGEVVRQAVADIRERRYDKMGLGSSYLFRLDEGWVIDASMKGSTARFVNHSCNPSCTARVVKVAGQKRIVIYALRAIEVGKFAAVDVPFASLSPSLPGRAPGGGE